jgi:beta-lactamase class D
MNKTKSYEKAFDFSGHNHRRFLPASTYMINTHAVSLDDTPLKEEHRPNAIDQASWNMAIGEALTRNRYLVIGVAMGVAASAVAVKIYKKFKRKSAHAHAISLG